MIYNKDYFIDRLMPILKRFCKDNDFEVRCTIALQFHEIVKLQKTNEQFLLISPFVELLCSETAEIIQRLMGNLHEILPLLYSSFKSSNMHISNNTIEKQKSFEKDIIVFF